MANITIKNIPSEIHGLLKKRAKANRRSINSEVILCLQLSVFQQQRDREDTVKRLAKIRNQLRRKDVYITNDELNRSKRKGRL